MTADQQVLPSRLPTITLPFVRETSPIVGLIPTMLFLLLGETMEPSVSDPREAAASPTAIATPLPELEPEASPFG